MVAVSSAEAEYMASTNATKEAIWLQQLCKDIGFHEVKAFTIICDNQSCIDFTQNSKFPARKKHVEFHHDFVRKKVVSGDVETKHCNTKDKYADFLTRNVPRPKHGLGPCIISGDNQG